jgi:hypothetical protein
MAQVDKFDMADRLRGRSCDIEKSRGREKRMGGWKGFGMAEMERLDGIGVVCEGVGTVSASGVGRVLLWAVGHNHRH